jgi:hypothetical protein
MGRFLAPRHPAGSRVTGATRLWLANTVIVTLAALLTAGLGLLTEDVLVQPGDQVRFLPWRVAFVAVMLSGVVGALWWRSRLRRRAGTLYYLAMLDEAMVDRHVAGRVVAQRRRLYARSLVRWVDLTPSQPDGVLDLVDECRELGVAVEDAVNNHWDDSGCTVAPNLLWPMAIAVGMQLPVREDMRTLELPTSSDDTEIEFAVSKAARTEVEHTTVDLTTTRVTSRIGVWLAFTSAAANFADASFAQFGVGTVHVLSMPGQSLNGPFRPFTAAELEGLAPVLAEHLLHIRNSDTGREMVIVAMIPKSVALLIGHHLAGYRGSLFRRTYLMHHDQPSGHYVAMRVRSSQPTGSPINGQRLSNRGHR